MIAVLIFLLVFYAFSSLCEAGYFHLRNKCHLHISFEHIYLVFMRLPVWGLAYMQTGIFTTIAMMLVFPFIHDGVYYWGRHKLDDTIYPRTFLDYSKTDTSILSFNLITRTSLFCVGVLILVVKWGS